MAVSDQFIGFNKPYITGGEISYIGDAIQSEHLSGNGKFTKLCQDFFSEKFGINKSLLTSSCTDALEMSAILADIQPGDEVVVPSYTFVSSANAFVLRGAKVVFADSLESHPNIDCENLEELITSKTKAIVPVHYSGIACNMEKLTKLAEKHYLLIIEDAAQAIDSYYISNDSSRKALGSIGDFGTFSFHETKNIICGEGGLLAVNRDAFSKRSEIIWEKGTNRASFYRGEVNKYGWVDIGSSFLPSEITAAFLWAQLENLGKIQKRRLELWELYNQRLAPLEEKGVLKRPIIPDYATNNAHMFYVVFESSELRKKAIEVLAKNNIQAVFHYISLHSSPYYKDRHDGRELPQADKYTVNLLRLPMYYELLEEEVNRVCDILTNGL